MPFQIENEETDTKLVESVIDTTEVPDDEQQADAAPVETDAASEEITGDDAPAPLSRRQKRIAILNGEKATAIADRDHWRDDAYALRRELDALRESAQPAAVATVVDAPKRPNIEDFDHDVSAWSNALGDWTEKQIDFKADQKAAEITAQGQRLRATEAKETATQQRVQKFNERSIEFAKTHDDYFDIVGRRELNITQDMTDAITDMENGPGVSYYLGLNPEVAFRIAQKETPAAVGAALNAIETKVLADNPKPVSSNESDAPEPPSTIGTGRSTVKGKDPTNAEHTAKMSTDDWFKQRTKQVRKRTNG